MVISPFIRVHVNWPADTIDPFQPLAVLVLDTRTLTGTWLWAGCRAMADGGASETGRPVTALDAAPRPAVFRPPASGTRRSALL
ncbi:hypothetical protein [Streptomyces nogalater]|uniref:Uncharacterized protein n=1 Tax=Streptomyces nogalater TaxID=38314 RepID=A0ABW0WN61_STRNO